MTRTFPADYLRENPEELRTRLRALNLRMGVEAHEIKARNGNCRDDDLPADELHALDAVAHVLGSLVGSAELADRTESLMLLITGLGSLYRVCDDMESHPNLPPAVVDVFTVTADIIEGK